MAGRGGELARYRCRVGHAYSEDSLLIEQGSAVEAALWSALEAVEERAEFLAWVAQRHGDRRPRLRDVIVQDPEDATVASMPESALRAVGEADAVLTADAIGPKLARIAEEAVGMRQDMPVASVSEGPGLPTRPPTSYSCPECQGPLWQVEEGDLVRYRCRVGHGYSEDSLLIEQGTAVEAALWSALEALEERAEFLGWVAQRHGDRRARLRDRFEGAATDALERAELIRRALGTAGEPPPVLDLQATE